MNNINVPQTDQCVLRQAACIIVMFLTVAARGVDHSWWIEPGAGYVNSAKHGVVSGIQTSQQWGIHQATLRFTFAHIVPIYGGESAPLFDIGLLYGIAFNRNLLETKNKARWDISISVSGGLAAVNYGYVEENTAEDITTVVDGNFRAWTIGIPAQLEVFLIPRRNFGFGINAFANWNKHKSFWGACISVRFGKIRGRV